MMKPTCLTETKLPLKLKSRSESAELKAQEVDLSESTNFQSVKTPSFSLRKPWRRKPKKLKRRSRLESAEMKVQEADGSPRVQEPLIKLKTRLRWKLTLRRRPKLKRRNRSRSEDVETKAQEVDLNS